MNKENCCNTKSRKATVGGQAVVEGVMMKSKTHCAIAVRADDGTINVESRPYTTICQRTKLGKIPVVRGVVNFAETLKLSMDTLTRSTEMLGIEEEPSKFEKWLSEKLGKSLMSVVSAVGVILGVLLSVGLFIFLPTKIADLIIPLFDIDADSYLYNLIYSLTRGVFRIIIFVAYLMLISLWKDMYRVFQYHGSEHMSIFAYENGDELTVENVKKYKRFHPRCGTSFMVVMMIISILLLSLVPWNRIGGGSLVRTLIGIVFLPLIVGVGYEFLMFAGKHDDNTIMKILSAPGLWVQRITTKQPDDDMLEVAIASLKASLPEVFPPEEATEQNENDGI